LPSRRAARIVVYEVYDLLSILAVWFLASIAVILIWKALCFIAHRIILFRVNINQEVLEQRNIAAGGVAGGYLYLARVTDFNCIKNTIINLANLNKGNIMLNEKTIKIVKSTRPNSTRAWRDANQALLQKNV
jgi:hypothetical protein